MGCASSAPAQYPPPGGHEQYAPPHTAAPQQYAPVSGQDDATIDFSGLNIKQLQVLTVMGIRRQNVQYTKREILKAYFQLPFARHCID